VTLPWAQSKSVTEKRAIAYYRHSAQDRQENSIEIQQEQVRKFAAEHSIEMIREFADRGKTGLCVEGRDAFNEMLHDYVEGDKEKFDYVLVLDVSRWGRFQETDLSAYYTGLCLTRGKQVIFTTIGFPKPDDLLHGLHLSIERYRAASYSRELSGKVWKGCAKIASTGYWAGGSPPYAMQRLLLDEARNPVRMLKDGEHKAIHNQRVTLAPGDDDQVSVVRTIFDRFATQGVDPGEIADRLNFEGIPSPGGSKWSKGSVMWILQDEVYAGAMVWNRTSQKMKSRSRRNPPGEWVRAEGAFEPIVPNEVFQRVQVIIRTKEEERTRRRSREDMLAKLLLLYEQYGTVSNKLIRGNPDMLPPSTYANRFTSLDRAYQSLFKELIDSKKLEIVTMLKDEDIIFEHCDDFLVIDNYFSLTIQPTVPIPHGYDAYWLFHPDQRRDVDLTIGVPLSSPERCDILGYLAFPRMLFRNKVRIATNRCSEPSLWAHPLITLIQQLRS
jgi:DNA invertase Pin-like site-specific DNA recombinase